MHVRHQKSKLLEKRSIQDNGYSIGIRPVKALFGSFERILRGCAGDLANNVIATTQRLEMHFKPRRLADAGARFWVSKYQADFMV